MPQHCQNIIIRKRLRNTSTALDRWLRSFLHLLFKLTKCVQMRHLITKYQFSFSHIAPHSHTLEELDFFAFLGMNASHKHSAYIWERKGKGCFWTWLYGAKFCETSSLFKAFLCNKRCFFHTVSEITSVRYCQRLHIFHTSSLGQ